MILRVLFGSLSLPILLPHPPDLSWFLSLFNWIELSFTFSQNYNHRSAFSNRYVFDSFIMVISEAFWNLQFTVLPTCYREWCFVQIRSLTALKPCRRVGFKLILQYNYLQFVSSRLSHRNKFLITKVNMSSNLSLIRQVGYQTESRLYLTLD